MKLPINSNFFGGHSDKTLKKLELSDAGMGSADYNLENYLAKIIAG